MSKLLDRISAHWEGRDGFAMPVVLLALAVMTTIAVAALTTATDEQKSARAVREGGRAFYVAEAGLWESWANWPADSIVSGIAQGDSLDLGWKSLDNGGEYRGEISRWGPTTFGLIVESRGAGPLGGQQWLSLLVNYEPSLKIGRCCDAAALVDGVVEFDDTVDEIHGQDAHPPGWESAGVCQNGLEDKPGLIMKDTTQVVHDNGTGEITGVPSMVEDTTINDATFDSFGDKTWADLKALANHTVGSSLSPEPSYSGGDCDTSDPENWGSNDPNDPCFDYFPIILIQGDVDAEDNYGQGILILDWDPVTLQGSEIDLEDGMVYNGIILGKGCIEVQRGAVLNGAAFVDGKFGATDLCDPDMPLDINSNGEVQYSSCAIERAIKGAGLTGFGEAGAAGYTPLKTRAFAQLPR